ncbi:MAG: hypothetical protein ACFCUU_13100 [Cyclobacteriaceae bacterium]
MKINIIIITALMFTMLACGQKKQKAEQQLMVTKVMAVHDEIMPEMDRITYLQNQLSAKIESIDETEIDAEEQIAELEQAKEDLKQAHEAMMHWMRNLKKNQDLEVLPHDEAMEYLLQEYNNINGIKQLMEESIANAESHVQS